ncbi:hypothetical protein DPX16_5372 [Anabarilius grahami]|uniref:Uncharacterized protein n=1 Tax=Anabarilius grahami TaxID=495550 RepID=A0A3N0XQD0_ANAGA|nr:hypothetical protein DPX16_5372 [Anabarilius grahami]
MCSTTHGNGWGCRCLNALKRASDSLRAALERLASPCPAEHREPATLDFALVFGLFLSSQLLRTLRRHIGANHGGGVCARFAGVRMRRSAPGFAYCAYQIRKILTFGMASVDLSDGVSAQSQSAYSAGSSVQSTAVEALQALRSHDRARAAPAATTAYAKFCWFAVSVPVVAVQIHAKLIIAVRSLRFPPSDPPASLSSQVGIGRNALRWKYCTCPGL